MLGKLEIVGMEWLPTHAQTICYSPKNVTLIHKFVKSFPHSVGKSAFGSDSLAIKTAIFEYLRSVPVVIWTCKDRKNFFLCFMRTFLLIACESFFIVKVKKIEVKKKNKFLRNTKKRDNKSWKDVKWIYCRTKNRPR